MGIEKKNRTFRLCDDTQAKLVQIQQALWPFCEDLSSTIRLIIRVMHALLFMPQSVGELFSSIQLLHRKALQCDAVRLPLSLEGARR